MSENETKPKLTDKRSSAAKGATEPTGPASRPDARTGSLYEPTDPADLERLYRKSRTQLGPTRYPLHENPHDDDADPDSGWEYVHLAGAETPDHLRDISDTERYRDVHGGTPSGVMCFRCHSTEYLIIDERKPAQVAETMDDVKWAISQNREYDRMRTPTVWALFCPGCKHQAQLRESVVRSMRGEKIDHYD